MDIKETKKLLDLAIENGILICAEDQVFIAQVSGWNWWSKNALAEELITDKKGQDSLIQALKEKGINFSEYLLEEKGMEVLKERAYQKYLLNWMLENDVTLDDYREVVCSWISTGWHEKEPFNEFMKGNLAGGNGKIGGKKFPTYEDFLRLSENINRRNDKEKWSNEFQKSILEQLDQRLCLPGYKDYIQENFAEALEVVHNGGNMYDLDGIVAIEKILGFRISYGLYSVIDSQFDEDVSIAELCENADKETIEKIEELLAAYLDLKDKSEEVRVHTPEGDLVAYYSNDPNNPGIWVDIEKDGSGTALALVEYSSTESDLEGGNLISRVYGNGLLDEYTNRVIHSNVDEYFDSLAEPGRQDMEEYFSEWFDIIPYEKLGKIPTTYSVFILYPDGTDSYLHGQTEKELIVLRDQGCLFGTEKKNDGQGVFVDRTGKAVSGKIVSIHGESAETVCLKKKDGAYENCVCETWSGIGSDGRTFIFLPCRLDAKGVMNVIKLFDTWYGDTNQTVPEYAVEFQLLVRMLLAEEGPYLLVNPQSVKLGMRQLKQLADVINGKTVII